MRVLIVEDESLVALEIESFVKELGYEVCGKVKSTEQALDLAGKKKIDTVLMDVHIQGQSDGVECAKLLQKKHIFSLIYISAFSDDETLERAIETEPLGYLIKPFNRRELKFMLKVAQKNKTLDLRRGDLVLDDEFSYDTHTNELLMLGEVVHLTRKEQQLLEFLLHAKNGIVGFYELENELWPDKPSNENTRRALVSRLRTKLKYRFIETIHSIGYKIIF